MNLIIWEVVCDARFGLVRNWSSALEIAFAAFVTVASVEFVGK